MQTENKVAERNDNFGEQNEQADVLLMEKQPDVTDTAMKHDHHNSAIYAASHLHSAVNHVKPRHSNHLEF